MGVKQAEGQSYFSLVATEDAEKQPPLNQYRDDRERAALTLPQFQAYVRLQMPANGSARRIFSFASSIIYPETKDGLDPAILDYPRHRGRVIVYTGTLSPERLGPEQVWSNWPLHPTFLPFLHETLRYAVATGSRRNLLPGDAIEEFLPLASVGLERD